MVFLSLCKVFKNLMGLHNEHPEYKLLIKTDENLEFQSNSIVFKNSQCDEKCLFERHSFSKVLF